MYFDEVGGGTASNAVADTLTFWTNLKNVIDNSLLFTIEAEVAIVSEGTGQVTGIVGTAGGAVAGDDAGDPAPWATQGLIRWRTGTFIAGREVRGRTFIPGVTEARANGGVPDASYKSNCVTAINALIGSTNSTLVSWSRKNGDSAPVIAGSPWEQFAVLRSRRD